MEAVQIDWGTILLFGGGLALGHQTIETGLSHWIGNLVVHVLGVRSVWALTVVMTCAALLLTQLTRNTVAAAVLCPLAVVTALQIGTSPVAPCIATALATQMAFSLPTSTRSNTIIFATERVRYSEMARTGLWGVVFGVALIPPLTIGVCAMLRLGAG
jgi:sodium-dependent dicarboxylate transporter 2/3/5